MSDASRLPRDADGRPVVETRFRVRYFETDAMGIVHHAAYITWFEEGRSAFTRALGYPYARMEADGLLLAVAEVNARYHLPARYDDEVIVTTALDALLSRGMNFSYKVRRARDGALLVTGYTHHVSIDRAGRIRRIPEEIRQRILAGLDYYIRA